MKFKVGPLFHVLIYDIALGIVHVSVMRMKMVNDEDILSLKEHEMNDKKIFSDRRRHSTSLPLPP